MPRSIGVRPYLSSIVVSNPFKHEARSDQNNLRVCLLKVHPTPGSVAAVRHLNTGSEHLVVHGREAYVYYPDVIGGSRFELRWACAARNWDTIVNLHALMAPK